MIPTDQNIFNRVLQVLQKELPEENWKQVPSNTPKYAWFLQYETEINKQTVFVDTLLQSYKTWIKNPGRVPPLEADDSDAYRVIVQDFLANGW